MEWITLTLAAGKEITVNVRLITDFSAFEGDGGDILKTEICFMGGGQIIVQNSYDEVKTLLVKD